MSTTKLPSRSDRDLLKLGERIDDAEVARLEKRLEADSSDRDSRLLLLSATRAAPELRADQVKWFIRNEPRTYLGPALNIAVAQRGYDDARSLWLAAIEENGSDPDIAENAALFFLPLEPLRGGEILEAHAGRAPNRDSYCRLFSYWYHASSLLSEHRETFASRSLGAGYRAIRLSQLKEIESILGRLADAARLSRDENGFRLLSAARQAYAEWSHVQDPLRAQLAQAVFGLVALAEGDVDGAIEHLNASSVVNALPSRAVRLLAEQLLALGQRNAVVTALAVWRDRIEALRNVVSTWIDTIQQGLEPTSFSFDDEAS